MSENMRLINSSQQLTLNINGKPDEDYVFRILRACRENCNGELPQLDSSESTDDLIINISNKQYAERIDRLDDAIEILQCSEIRTIFELKEELNDAENKIIDMRKDLHNYFIGLKNTNYVNYGVLITGISFVIGSAFTNNIFAIPGLLISLTAIVGILENNGKIKRGKEVEIKIKVDKQEGKDFHNDLINDDSELREGSENR